jgi:DNA repair and recombination RAD54-like protein
MRLFEEDTPAAPAPVEDEGTAAAHRLSLWSPPVGDPDGRHEVVVDPVLSAKLREHQREGVQFMFDCLMGLKPLGGHGCILADDMGLGKTLQSVAIIWTLLKQGGPGGKPACRKCLVVCPASLVKNWAAEFDKWLHGECKHIAVSVAGQAQVSGCFSAFKHSHDVKVLIASYETFRGHASQVAEAGIDLVVCDEAHKLKNDDAATTRCISALPARRRLLISGTPIQNNLEEFYTLASVANPGIFGDFNDFRRRYQAPILKGREPTATAEERRRAEETLARISEMTEQFILRRTNKLNAKYLPAKQLYNVFVVPTAFQRRLYHKFLRSSEARNVLEGNVALNRTVLCTIKKLMSLVNHPFLVRSATQRLDKGFDDEETRAMFAQVDELDRGVRSQQKSVHPELSGKLSLLHALLVNIKASGSGDRVVVISNWVQTLDLIEKMCEHNNWPVHRLDGKAAIGKRMKLVTDFNRPENREAYVFLLSSKAGGCGLNLIGANRLVMYDPDWNPANDRQAMARIWRDGQKKVCYIYRLFTTGTIDEKIYQRQICKDGLSAMMVTDTGDEEPTEMKESLDAEVVKDLFTLNEDTPCSTHDMISCKRCGTNAFVPQSLEAMEDNLASWSHHAGCEGVDDLVLASANRQLRSQGKEPSSACGVSFVMGCRIEFTKEMIDRLEEEDRVRREQRKAANLAPAISAASDAGHPTTVASCGQDVGGKQSEAMQDEHSPVGRQASAKRRRTSFIDVDNDDSPD